MKLVDVNSRSCTHPTEKWHNGKSDENLLELLLQTSAPPNKWIKHKAALLSPLPLSVWWTLVSDESLSWPYSAGSHVMLSHRSLPPGLPQEESGPWALHAKYLSCLRKKCDPERTRSGQRLSNVSVTMRFSEYTSQSQTKERDFNSFSFSLFDTFRLCYKKNKVFVTLVYSIALVEEYKSIK